MIALSLISLIKRLLKIKMEGKIRLNNLSPIPHHVLASTPKDKDNDGGENTIKQSKSQSSTISSKLQISLPPLNTSEPMVLSYDDTMITPA